METKSEQETLDEKSTSAKANSSGENFEQTLTEKTATPQSSESRNSVGGTHVINMPEYMSNPLVFYDFENNKDKSIRRAFHFNDKSIRRAFVIKVYGIVLSQLMISASFIAWFMLHEPTMTYVMKNRWVLWVSLGGYISSYLVMLCCEPARRKVPVNFMLLLLFTSCLSLLLGMFSSIYDAMEVLQAFGITMVIVVSLTIFAWQTKYDFTTMNGSLFVTFLVIVLFGLIAVITRSPSLYLLYCGFAVLFFSIFLVYDTQTIINGGHRYKMSPEEYVFAAVCIYLDIINIFVKILRIFRL